MGLKPSIVQGYCVNDLMASYWYEQCYLHLDPVSSIVNDGYKLILEEALFVSRLSMMLPR